MPDITTILFYVFSFLVVSFAFIVVFARNVIYSAVALFVSLFFTAGLYLLLKADFIALTQLLLYIGGILVLLIFGIMLTTRITDAEIRTKNLSYIPATIVTSGIFVIMMVVILTTKWNVYKDIPTEETITHIGKLLLSTYLLPFEIASVVLLVALIGAAMYARKK